MVEDTTPAKGEIRIDGDKLKLVAKREGMTLGVLADAVGMHYNGIGRIVATGVTTLKTLEEICNVLRCNPLDLIVWHGFEPVDPKLEALAEHFSRLGIPFVERREVVVTAI
jgi:DNA-binding Xre family transcriptional regulator